MKHAGFGILLGLVMLAAAGCGEGRRPDLSGEWDGWGRVTLTGLTGSYTDSYGRASTKIVFLRHFWAKPIHRPQPSR